MISWPLIRRTLRDYAGLWAALGALIVAFAILFMYAIHATPIGQQGGEFLKMPFVRRVLTVMLGSDPLAMLTPSSISSFAFTHPLVWTLLIVFALTTSSGILAGEVDRGTMDLLASLPLSRAAIYSSAATMTIFMGLPLCWLVWVGVLAGKAVAGASEVRMDVLVRLTWHLCATYALIASFSTAISAACNRRGTSVAIAFFIIFYAFVLNMLRAIWPALDRLAWTDFLNYYQCFLIVRDEAYRWRDIAVLLCAAAAWWIAGLIMFVKRDVPAR